MKHILIILAAFFIGCTDTPEPIERDAITYSVSTYFDGGEGSRCGEMDEAYCAENPDDECCMVTAVNGSHDFIFEESNGGFMLYFTSLRDDVRRVEVTGFYKGSVFIVHTINNPLAGARYAHFDNLNWID